MPLDICPTGRCRGLGEPDELEQLGALGARRRRTRRAAGAARAARRRSASRGSGTARRGSRARAGPRASRPARPRPARVPAVGRTSPQAIFTSVDLPAPFGPEQPEQLALADLEPDAAQRLGAPVASCGGPLRRARASLHVALASRAMATRACTESPPPLHWTGTTPADPRPDAAPGRGVVLELHGTPDTVEAIKRLAVRGAPLIGVAAAYGLAMELARDETPEALERAAALMAGARPTARNLGWAVERVTAAALAAPGRMADAAREAAEQIHREDEAASAALARHGADALEAVLPDGPVAVMTHCNSGALAASGRGTGARRDRRARRPPAGDRARLRGAPAAAGRAADRVGVRAARARPRAARRLRRRRPDRAAARSHAVVTGFDRVAANGDVANKVGTYGLALAARAARIPFVAAGPSSSVDLRLRDRRRDRDRGARRRRGPPRRRRAADRRGHAACATRRSTSPPRSSCGGW